MKKVLSIFLILFSSLSYFTSCGSSKAYTPPSQIQPTFTNKTNSVILSTEEGIDIRVDIDYSIDRNGYLDKGCGFSYLLTNLSKTKTFYGHLTMGEKRANGNDFLYGKTATLVCDVTTSDGKIINLPINLNVTIPPNRTTEIRKASANIGNRYCTGIIIKEIKYYGGENIRNQ